MPQRGAKWQEMIREQQRGDLGVSAFCRARGVSTACFYTWRKRLGQTGSDVAAEPPVRFLEVKLADAPDPIAPLPATCALIEVRLREGRSLLVAPGFDAIHLRRMLPWKNVVSCAGNSRRSCSTSCARSFLSERSSYFPGIP